MFKVNKKKKTPEQSVKPIEAKCFCCSIVNFDQVNAGWNISPYSVLMWENMNQKKLRVWTFFTQ